MGLERQVAATPAGSISLQPNTSWNAPATTRVPPSLMPESKPTLQIGPGSRPGAASATYFVSWLHATPWPVNNRPHRHRPKGLHNPPHPGRDNILPPGWRLPDVHHEVRGQSSRQVAPAR